MPKDEENQAWIRAENWRLLEGRQRNTPYHFLGMSGGFYNGSQVDDMLAHYEAHVLGFKFPVVPAK